MLEPGARTRARLVIGVPPVLRAAGRAEAPGLLVPTVDRLGCEELSVRAQTRNVGANAGWDYRLVNVAVCRSPSASTAVTVCVPAVNLRRVHEVRLPLARSQGGLVSVLSGVASGASSR